MSQSHSLRNRLTFPPNPPAPAPSPPPVPSPPPPPQVRREHYRRRRRHLGRKERASALRSNAECARACGQNAEIALNSLSPKISRGNRAPRETLSKSCIISDRLLARSLSCLRNSPGASHYDDIRCGRGRTDRQTRRSVKLKALTKRG